MNLEGCAPTRYREVVLTVPNLLPDFDGKVGGLKRCDA